MTNSLPRVTGSAMDGRQGFSEPQGVRYRHLKFRCLSLPLRELSNLPDSSQNPWLFDHHFWDSTQASVVFSLFLV